VALAVLLSATLGAAAAELHQIVQKGRAFSLGELAIAAGDTVRFTNDDEFLHQIYVRSDTFNFESAEQSPGETVDLRFPVPGVFAVQCEIHPKMHLTVTVK
jgi:plastocyanin